MINKSYLDYKIIHYYVDREIVRFYRFTDHNLQQYLTTYNENKHNDQSYLGCTVVNIANEKFLMNCLDEHYTDTEINISLFGYITKFFDTITLKIKGKE